jgi:hypothetical protein
MKSQHTLSGGWGFAFCLVKIQKNTTAQARKQGPVNKDDQNQGGFIIPNKEQPGE